MAEMSKPQESSAGAVSEGDLDALLTQIAARHIAQAHTLQERGADSLDFLDVAVWSLKDALTEAFIAGQRAGGNGVTEIA